MICAGCGRGVLPVPGQFHAGPYRLVKCPACGPWLPDEVAQARAEALKRNGIIPVRRDAPGRAGGCGCIGER